MLEGLEDVMAEVKGAGEDGVIGIGLEAAKFELEFEGDRGGEMGVELVELDAMPIGEPIDDESEEGELYMPEWEIAIAMVEGLVGEVDGTVLIFIVSMSMPSVARGFGNR